MAALTAIRLPEVDAPKLDIPNLKVPKAIEGMSLPAIDMPDVDLAGAVAGVATATGVRRPARRSPLPFAIAGLIVAGTAAWAIMNSQELRDRLAGFATTLRERVSSMRSNGSDQSDPIAFPAAETRPIQPDPLKPGDDLDAPDYPEGLGSRDGDRMPARKKSANPI